MQYYGATIEFYGSNAVYTVYIHMNALHLVTLM